ncbi:ESX secretion-associated protein EspG [Nocardia arizonensis]|uniref:ESX secretion-associated protein EspG n=1 Tax=Nocardia arizonensis TaxID=1141647 RepID=UPI0006D01C5D|nr:ESX secretion-associated protein EspG [Nocardia arizonensis]
MTHSWQFTGDEFDALWAGVKEEFMPDPFIHTCPPRSAEEGDRIRREAYTDIRQRCGGDLDEIVDVLVHPDIRVIVQGYGGGENLSDPGRSVRLLAARKGEVGYMVRQKPGETVYHAEGFVVTRHDAVALGEVIARNMPEAEGGRDGEIPLDEPADTELDYSYQRSLVHHSDDEQAARAAAFQRTPAEREGLIRVEQGWSRFGPRGVLRLQLEWRDLDGDGRYVVVPGTPPRAVGADRVRVTGLINAQIAEVVRAIKDDRA